MVRELSRQGFILSTAVSDYIIKNILGTIHKTILGIIQMKKGSDKRSLPGIYSI